MAEDARPRALHVSRSFTRMESKYNDRSHRRRASTLQDNGIPAVPAARRIATSPDRIGKRPIPDIFETNDQNEENGDGDGALEETTNSPALEHAGNFDDLPIEIRSLTERFVESLSAKVHPTPLNAENLSQIFQDFYARAASHIDTHIAILRTRLGRERSPSHLIKNTNKTRSRAGSGAKNSSDDLQNYLGGEMLTSSEYKEKRKAEAQLETKRVALEEAVERYVCEKVYDKIWQHRSTDDEARDEKLRSRMAALAVVDIKWKELLSDHESSKVSIKKIAEEKEDEVNTALSIAREALQNMDNERSPLGKLQLLTAAQQNIVDTLSTVFGSSSSADEILPTLIYTLITCPLTGFNVNVISNLNFIQRFRAANKVDGTVAYCLVTLGASIQYLETVDLPSLRADEQLEGPQKQPSRPETPNSDIAGSTLKPTIARTITPEISQVTATSGEMSSSTHSVVASLPAPVTTAAAARPALQARRLSSIVQAQAERIEAGRDNLLQVADKLYESVNGTLDNGLQFLFGRFKEQISAAGDSALPKTLEDAKRLVSPAVATDTDERSLSGRSSPAFDHPLRQRSTDPKYDKMLEAVAGRRALRERSTDSSQSGTSSGANIQATSLADASEAADTGGEKLVAQDRSQAISTFAATGNLLASINPLNRLGVPGFAARFARSGGLTPPNPSVTSAPAAHGSSTDKASPPTQTRADGVSVGRRRELSQGADSMASSTDDLNARETLAELRAELRSIKPPKQRFLEAQGSSDLAPEEVEELLLEYRRLAKAIGDAMTH